MSNGWHQGLCNCCGDISLCLCGLFCWPCLICSNARGLGKSGLIYNILGCFLPCLPVFLLRQNAREKYGIEGGDVEDVVSIDSSPTEGDRAVFRWCRGAAPAAPLCRRLSRFRSRRERSPPGKWSAPKKQNDRNDLNFG